MLIGSTTEELEKWKSQMYQYEKAKRTKKPFGREFPIVQRVTEKQVKQQQTGFNPVLQTFKNPNDEAKTVEKEFYQRARSLAEQMKQQAKHQKQYDIINLHPFTDESEQIPRERLNQVPLRNNYNIVSNQPLPDYYYKNRATKFNMKQEKKVNHQSPRDYNIITNVFKLDDKEKKQTQWKDLQKKEEQKYWKTHQYNPINGMYYDMNKQQQYQQQLQKEMKQHGKNQKLKLPPSYLKRLPVVIDPSKQIPQQAKAVQQKIKNSKKRYETRYIAEKEYQDRNFQDYLKQQSIIKNKPHQKRIADDQNKQFDIINLQDYNKHPQNNNKPLGSTWDKIIQAKNLEKPDFVTFGKSKI